MRRACWLALAVIMQGMVSMAHADGWDPDSKADNLVSRGMEDTRHNLSLTYLEGGTGFGGPVIMEFAMNAYGEICVYCHTPHGANTSSGVGMPLWNRTITAGLTYTPYSTPTTLGFAGEQTVTDPGPASLTCLSCHDGVTAIDSIINMPGSGGYRALQETEVNTAFLSEWVQLNPAAHLSLDGCAHACHNDGGPAEFRNFIIGAGTDANGQYDRQSGNVVDLSDDHPIGVLYPTALTNQAWVGFRVMDVEMPGRYAFFDDGNGRLDKYEIRAYDSGDGFEVECASCHDPHGVPDAANVEFIPSFLRVSNEGSALCLTCHIK